MNFLQIAADVFKHWGLSEFVIQKALKRRGYSRCRAEAKPRLTERTHPSKSPFHSPSFPLVTHKHLEDTYQVAKSRGFDLTDLRGYQEQMEHGPVNHGSASGTRPTPTATTRTKNSGPRDRNFEQMPSDVGVFYSENLLPAAGPIPESKNFEQLQEIALRRRPSLSHDRFTNADYRAFKHILETSNTDASIMTNIIPIIEGTSQERDRSCVDKPFNNVRQLMAGMVCSTPDKYYGSNPTEVNLEVQRKLGDSIFPSTVEGMPVAPNFFLEVKGRFGMPGVADRQALHRDALGERGQIALRAWRQDGSGLDKMAHTITSKYQDGVIELFSIHAEASRIQNSRTDYYMNSIFICLVRNGAESFRTGASAYWNLRDFAGEQRRESIDMANSMT